MLKPSVIFLCLAVAVCLVVGTRSNNLVIASTAVQEKSTKSEAPSTNAVHAEMRNVMYHFSDKIVAHIRMLSGELEPTRGKNMPVFDDKNSFSLRISNAEIAMNTASLTNAFNSYVFASPRSPLKDVKMTIADGKLKVKGRLHDKGDIPFEADGELTPTPDGKLRMQADKIRALHLPVKGFMDLIGADIADFIRQRSARAICGWERIDFRFEGDASATPHRGSGDRGTDPRAESNSNFRNNFESESRAERRWELHGVPRKSTSLRQTDDEQRRSDACGYGSKRPV